MKLETIGVFLCHSSAVQNKNAVLTKSALHISSGYWRRIFLFK